MDKSGQTFFSQLRNLAVKIERECEQYRQSIAGKNEDFCPSTTAKIISDLKKDVKLLESPLQAEHERQKKERQKLKDISAATESFLNTHLSETFSELEHYLAQYGYKPYEDENDKTNVTEEETAAAQGGGGDVPADKEVPKTPPMSKPPVDPNRTPRLEDAGISQDTLQYLNSLQKNKPQTHRPANHAPSWCNIPSEFQHNGIICTPSLAKSLNADMSYSTDLHSALASPVLFSTTNLMPTVKEKDVASAENQQLNKETSCPKSPTLCTPGIKQILSNTHTKYDHKTNSSHETKKRPVNVGLFQSGDATSSVKAGKEPKVPDLTARYDDDEPVEPELTYSLEALSDMTGMYMINATKPLASVKPRTIHLAAAENKENATPPEPEMLTSRIGIGRVNQEPQSFTTNEPRPTSYTDMPPSPKLLGSYNFLNN